MKEKWVMFLLILIKAGKDTDWLVKAWEVLHGTIFFYAYKKDSL